MPNFIDSGGFCTVYAHACGHLDTAEKNGDRQFISMGAEGAVYFVKCRGENPVWDTFERNSKGRKDARKRFMKLIRLEGAKRVIPKKSL